MTEIVKLDPKQYGLEESKAADIAAQFKPMLDKMVELEKEFNEVIALPIETAAPKAKVLRLKYVKVRTGTDAIHKTQKAFYLSAGRYVDGWKNTQLFASQGIEKKLEDIEQYAENKEKERIAALQAEREAVLLPYGVENIQALQLGSMTEAVFNNFLLGTKTSYDAKIEAERIAEEQRLAAIEAERIRVEEQRIENERLKAEAEERENAIALERAEAEAKRRELEEKARVEKEAAEKVLAEQRAEAARILAEEKAEAERILAEERRIAAEQLAKEQEAARKVAAELQVKKEAEAAEAERLAKIEADRVAAEKKAAKAPIKEKMKIAVTALVLELPESEITADVSAKFAGFKTWALQQIDKL